MLSPRRVRHVRKIRLDMDGARHIIHDEEGPADDRLVVAKAVHPRHRHIGGVEGSDDPILPIDGMGALDQRAKRSEEHTSELQSLMRISYAVFCLKTKNTNQTIT